MAILMAVTSFAERLENGWYGTLDFGAHDFVPPVKFGDNDSMTDSNYSAPIDAARTSDGLRTLRTVTPDYGSGPRAVDIGCCYIVVILALGMARRIG